MLVDTVDVLLQPAEGDITRNANFIRGGVVVDKVPKAKKVNPRHCVWWYAGREVGCRWVKVRQNVERGRIFGAVGLEWILVSHCWKS
jgi:hypothetical protein